MKYRVRRNYVELGEYLKTARLKAGLTQREVSEQLGYSSPQFVSNFETGIAAPPIGKLKKMVKAYSMPMGKLCKLILAGQERKLTRALYE